MANSIAYVLSKNTYPDPFQANLIGVDQGTQIVYATTSTLTTANKLFAESELIQPIYGDGTSWYGVQLLTNSAVVYPITISESGVIAIGSGTTLLLQRLLQRLQQRLQPQPQLQRLLQRQQQQLQPQQQQLLVHNKL